MAWSAAQGPAFEREHGITLADWLRTLPEAVGDHPLSLDRRTARVELGAGELRLEWDVLPARRIALIELPRLKVRYGFTDVPDLDRARFLRRFDLVFQRGGG